MPPASPFESPSPFAEEHPQWLKQGRANQTVCSEVPDGLRQRLRTGKSQTHKDCY